MKSTYRMFAVEKATPDNLEDVLNNAFHRSWLPQQIDFDATNNVYHVVMVNQTPPSEASPILKVKRQVIH